MKPLKKVIEQLSMIHTLYRQLLDTTKALLEAPLPDEDELEAIFDQRKNILSNIKKLETSINNQAQDEETRADDDLQTESSRVDELLTAIHETITELIDQDEKLKAIISAQKDSLAKELSRLAQGHKALKGYSQSRKGISYYVNTKS